MSSDNLLFDDREIDFLLYDVLRTEELFTLAAFAEHSRETVAIFLNQARKLARTGLWPLYRELDAEPPVFDGGRVRLHPKMRGLYAKLLGLGLITATRGHDVGGQSVPLVVDSAAFAYLIAANLSATSYLVLCRGTGHLIEAFGSSALKRQYMEPLYRGEWTGTMALTEPHAGSSLADLTTSARPVGSHYMIRGSKIFISGGDHDLTENIVHLVLARIEGAPRGTKGISLFVVPKMRQDGERLVDNDVAVSGMIHKIGWRALPSLIMSFGEQDDCQGWLVGEPNQGLSYMFQMMNEARIGVGLCAAATASVAYREALSYARARPQGRSLGVRDGGQVSIVEHADVKRMLLRQKAIAEGSMGLVLATARFADLSVHASTADERARAQTLLDLLTPIAKTFPAERGFESNALALQIHGGYGYSSEYLPEAWLRDQKLNSIHEGTTGIHSLDLLGRKAMAQGGAALRLLAEEIQAAIATAAGAGVPKSLCDTMTRALQTFTETSMHLGAMGMSGNAAGMMLHSVDYLDMASTVVVGWQWLLQATAAARKLAEHSTHIDLCEGKLHAAQYFIATEVPRVEHLAHLCATAEDSYGSMLPAWF